MSTSSKVYEVNENYSYVRKVEGELILDDLYYLPTHTPTFLTGSRAYGIPEPESDWDMVLYTDNMTLRDKLLAMSTDPNTIRVGKLNIILVHTITEYAKWAEGTRICMALAPVTREFAKRVFVGLGLKGHLEKADNVDELAEGNPVGAKWSVSPLSVDNLFTYTYSDGLQKLSSNPHPWLPPTFDKAASNLNKLQTVTFSKVPYQKVKTPPPGTVQFKKYSYGKKGG